MTNPRHSHATIHYPGSPGITLRLRAVWFIVFFICIFPAVAGERPDLIDEMQHARTPETMREASRLLNDLAHDDFERMKSRAGAPASLEFVRLTDRQNQLSRLSEPLVDEMIVIVHQLEKLDPADDDDIGLITQAGLSVELCQLARQNNAIIAEILHLLNEKVTMIDDPVIITEMFNGNPRTGEIILRLRDSQAEILSREQQGYRDFQCDRLLEHYTPL